MNAFRAINVDLHREWLDPLFWLITSSALGWVQTLLALLLLIWKNAREYVLPLLLADLIAGFFVADGIKLFVHRVRPSNLNFAIVQEGEYGANSFPSGHTSTAFGVAFTLWLMTRRTERAWMGQAAIFWAALVGFSRMYRGVHWPTDVFAGICAGAIGAACTALILTPSGRFPSYRQEQDQEPELGS